MRIHLWGGLLLMVALLTSAAPPPEPLCRIQAVMTPSPFLPLRSLSVHLRDCPVGHAFIRLASPTGATDPVYGFWELTQENSHVSFTGVLPHWQLEWRAASGRVYPVPEQPRVRP